MRGRELLADAMAGKQQTNSHGQEAIERVADEYQEDGEGRWQKFQQFGLKIIWLGQGKAKKATTILYGSIASEIEFEQDEKQQCVIRFEYETRNGAFRCTILGTDLDGLHNHISEGKRISIRVLGAIKEVQIEKIEEEEDEA